MVGDLNTPIGELGVSYLGRHDLAHVDPSEIGAVATAMGGREEADDDGNDKQESHAERFLSRGLLRGQFNKAKIVETKSGKQELKASPVAELQQVVNAGMGGAEGASLEVTQSPTPGGMMSSKAERVAQARVQGYEGEACSECGNFTLVRNGTCLKCDTCGSTSGCS